MADRARTVVERIDAGTPPDSAELQKILYAEAPAEAPAAAEGDD
jgi:hypothetical protein